MNIFSRRLFSYRLPVIGLCCGLFSVQVWADSIQATVSWAEVYRVSFEQKGRVNEVFINPGQFVKKGDELIKLDDTRARALLRMREADIAALQPVLQDKTREKKEAEALYEQTVLSQVELQKAVIAYDIAKAKAASAKHKKTIAAYNLAGTVLKAPWDAWVLNTSVRKGEVITEESRTDEQAVLARSNKLAASASITADSLANIKINDAIKVTYNGKDYPGRVKAISQSYHAQSFSVSKTDSEYVLTVEFEVNNAGFFATRKEAFIQLK